MEFKVVSTDFADVTVEADSPKEAIEQAVYEYENNTHVDYDYYSGAEIDSSLDTSYVTAWAVEELTPTLDRDALISALAENATESIDLKDLERHYLETQVNYLAVLTDEELIEYSCEHGRIDADEIQTDYTI